jgi:hypothetical protein
MKKLFKLLGIAVFIFFLGNSNSFAQFSVTGSTGADGTYASLTTATTGVFAKINATAQTGNNIIITVTGNSTSETGATSLNAGTWTSLKIYTTGTFTVSTSSISNPLINFNGADKVTIDGRIGQTGTTISLTLTATGNSTASTTIQFINDATNNTIQYCKITGACPSSGAGIIFFSTTSGTTGNDGNTIDNCEITSSTARPLNAIYSAGVGGKENSGNVISNNKIYDFFNTGTTSYGINLSSNSKDWSIIGNSFYETSSFIPSASVEYRVININISSSGNNINISGNYIGGSSTQCGGTAWTKTNAMTNTFSAIYLNVGATPASNVQGNIIKNFDWSNSGAAHWNGINVNSGVVNIGTITGNIIGASTGTGSISFTNGGYDYEFIGIKYNGTETGNIQNNTIGSITTNNSNTAYSTHIFGIYIPGTVTVTISNNIIGSTTTANSLNTSCASTLKEQDVCGIVSYDVFNNMIISGNSIANMTNGTTSTAGINSGIFIRSSGSYNISNNTIRDLSTNSSNGSLGSLSGISFENTGSNPNITISGNIIYNISAPSAVSFHGNIQGIYYKSLSSGTQIISKNLIYGISVNTNSTASCFGILIIEGGAIETCSNNFINLGGDTKTFVYGIWEEGANSNIYFNTVYIFGNLPSSTTNTSFAFYSQSSGNTRDIRNNIFCNTRSTTDGINLHYAAFFNYSSSTNLTLDYNDYYVSGTGGVLGYYGSTNKTSLPIVPGLDAFSLTENPPFINVSTPPYNLHINTVIPTSLESGGTTIPSITTDFDNDAKYPNSGYPIGIFIPRNPDIGADEFGGIAIDTKGPVIDYITLSNSTTVASRVFTNVIITDSCGVASVSGSGPRCYYKKSIDANTYCGNTFSDNGWKWVEANGTSSPFDFTFDYSILYRGGVHRTDQIMYFVVGQDLYPTPNVSINSGTFASPPTSVNLTSSAFPIGGTINSYQINSTEPLAGDYSVGLAAFNLITGKNLEPKEFTRKVLKNTEIKDNNKTTTGKKVVKEKYIALSENGVEYKGPMFVKYTPEIRKKFNLTDNTLGNYASITSAIEELNSVGISAPVRFLLLDVDYGATGTPETLPITLNQVTGAGSGATITIQPQTGITSTISGGDATAIFDINGGDYFIIDGRQNGNSTGKNLTIRNTNNSSDASSTIRLINDARNNTVQYCNIEGNSTATPTGGLVFFGTTTEANGNDNNYIQYNDIRDRSDASGSYLYGITSSGSTTSSAVCNSDNFIFNNNIYNFFMDGYVADGINIGNGSGDNWVISSNSFYQTASRTICSSTQTGWNVIYLNCSSPANVNNFTISNNYIGGSTANCGGTPWTYNSSTSTGSYAFLYGITGMVGSTVPTSIQGNTIQNFNVTAKMTYLTTNSVIFSGIIFTNASDYVNVGTSAGNIIGNATGNDNITINLTGSSTYYPVINAIDHRGNGDCNNNSIGSFTITSVTGYTFNGISRSGTPVATTSVSNNTIGSCSVSNSIQNSSTATTCSMTGINSSLNTVNLTMNGNTVSNLTNSGTTASTSNYIRGIIHAGTAIGTISSNTIKELSSQSQNPTANNRIRNAVLGIGDSSNAAGQTISQNVISGIRGTTTTASNISVIGLSMINSASATNGTISRNRIFDITNTSSGTATYIIGINFGSYSWILGNNQVTLTNGEATDKLKRNKPANPDNVLLKNENLNSINSKINFKKSDYGKGDKIQDIGKRNYSTEFDLSTNGVIMYGICNFGIGNSYYYNSVYIGGIASSGSANSFAFYKNNGSSITIKNNLFYNGRTNSGGTGKNYAIGSGTVGLTSNYNAFVSVDANTMGYFTGSDQTFAQWKTSISGDAQSYATTTSVISAGNLFNSIANGNLNINSGNSEAWLVSGKGTYISGQSTDFDGVDTRSVSLSTGVTDIGSDEFTATPPNCPVAIESAPPASGTTTSYTVFGRTLCDIIWGTGGSSYPTNVNLYYYSGVAPPYSTGNSLYSYCEITPTGTLTGATYDITQYFTDAETYTITSPSSNTRGAKYSNSEWTIYSGLGTGNLQTELSWSGKWAKVRGLSGFSLYTLTDVSNPLPIQITAFNSKVNNRDVLLNWVTISEYNNLGFEVQKQYSVSGSQYSEWEKIGFVKGSGTTNSQSTYSYADAKLKTGNYKYRLKQLNYNGNFKYFSLDGEIFIDVPKVFSMSQNYPNPFNPVTKIDFDIPKDGFVSLKIYDVLGREIKSIVNEFRKAGYYTEEFNATNFASGVYFYRIQTGDFVAIKKMLMIK